MHNIKVEEHTGLLKSIAARFVWACNDNISREDLEQEAHVAALRCVESYRPEKGEWPPFCDSCVHRHLMQFALGERSTIRVPVRVQRARRSNGEAQGRVKVQPSNTFDLDDTATRAELSAFSAPEPIDALDAVITKERATFATDLMRVLDDRERTVIQRCVFDGCSQVEVAAEMGCSRALVSKIQLGAISKMRAEADRLGREP